jgi:hypothetical protein
VSFSDNIPTQQQKNDTPPCATLVAATAEQHNATASTHASHKKQTHTSQHHKITGFNKQTSTVDVCGGGYADCLAASDIDRMLAPVIPAEKLLPAIRLYRIRTGFETPRDTKLQIKAALKTNADKVLHHCTSASTGPQQCSA